MHETDIEQAQPDRIIFDALKISWLTVTWQHDQDQYQYDTGRGKNRMGLLMLETAAQSSFEINPVISIV